MIPTLLGVTIVSFLIMQLAPGDPLRAKLGSRRAWPSSRGRTARPTSIQKQDLMLDKPLVLNFNYFRDFRPPVRLASHYLGISEKQVGEELEALARAEPQAAARLGFLRSLKIPDFEARFADPQKRSGADPRRRDGHRTLSRRPGPTRRRAGDRDPVQPPALPSGEGWREGKQWKPRYGRVCPRFPSP